MEKAFSLEYGIGGLCVLFTLMVMLKVGEFLWKLREKKETLSEAAVKDLTLAMQANTAATQHLDHRLQQIEKMVVDVPKFKTDLRRFYTALKILGGDRWPQVRDEIMKDEFTL